MTAKDRLGLQLCKACGDRAVAYFARHGTIHTAPIIADCPECSERDRAVRFHNATLEASLAGED